MNCVGTSWFGKTTISVPERHRVGNVELPSSFAVLGKRLYQQELDPEQHFVATSLKPLSVPSFVELLKRNTASSENLEPSALVFIHGYNASFMNAIYRTAQLSWDMNFKGTTFLYSWPSAARTSQYLFDQASAQSSETHFREFLKFIDQFGDGKVHFLAHGMGAALLMPVLDRLSLHSKRGRPPYQFGEVILAAPDMDAELLNEMCSRVRQIARGITIYPSASDKALNVAATLTGSGTRRGNHSDRSHDRPLCRCNRHDGNWRGRSQHWPRHFRQKGAVLYDLRLLICIGIRPPSSRSPRNKGRARRARPLLESDGVIDVGRQRIFTDNIFTVETPKSHHPMPDRSRVVPTAEAHAPAPKRGQTVAAAGRGNTNDRTD